jgi:hypothetical protein
VFTPPPSRMISYFTSCGGVDLELLFDRISFILSSFDVAYPANFQTSCSCRPYGCCATKWFPRLQWAIGPGDFEASSRSCQTSRNPATSVKRKKKENLSSILLHIFYVEPKHYGALSHHISTHIFLLRSRKTYDMEPVSPLAVCFSSPQCISICL